MTYYAYLHAKPGTEDASGIFYVGKGKGKRAYEFKYRNKYHLNKINKYGCANILVGKLECSDEKTAFDLEKGLIKCLKRMSISLVNLTDGGEGTSGLTQSSEHKAKLAKAHLGKKLSEEHRKKLSESHKGKPSNSKGKPSKLRGTTLSSEHRIKLSFSAKHRTYKLEHTETTKLKIGEHTARSKWFTDGVKNRRLQPEETQCYIGLGWKPGKSKLMKG